MVHLICSLGFNTLTLDLDAGVQELEARAEAANLEGLSVPQVHPIGDDRLSVPDPKSVTYVDYDDPFALFKRSIEASSHIVRLSKNAWVDCGEDIYVLECLRKGHIRIEPVSGGERNRRQATISPTYIFFHRFWNPFPRTLHPDN